MTSFSTSQQNRSALGADSKNLYKVVVATLILSLSVRVVSAYGAPEDTTIIPALPSETPADTQSIEPQAGGDVSARELRLRTIEDELLKKLSMGTAASSGEKTTSTLPDIKHVDSPTKTAPSKTSPQATTVTPKPTPAMQEAKFEPEQRTPRTIHIVPVSAKQAPRRTPQSTGSQDPKDLEHRLAIAESQATILSRELDSTKQNLQISESRVNELSQIVEKGTAAPAPKYREVGGYIATSTSHEDVRLALNSVNKRGIPSEAAPSARINRSNTPLRVGPGRRESSLFALSINSIVTIEHRTGTWYRVLTSDGTRGWVAGDALIFSDGDFPGSTVHIGGIRPDNEPESFR
jgi:hypothetical protein